MRKKDKLRKILTIVGWFVIGFAVLALVMFVVNSGVF